MSGDAAIVLAAGQGTRMRSSVPKVLQPLAGKPTLVRVLESLAGAGFSRPVVVVGRDGDQIALAVGDRCTYVQQPEAMGTGDATRVGMAVLGSDFSRVLVVHGDEALVPSAVYTEMLALQTSSRSPLVLATTICDDTRRFGRVVRDAEGHPTALVQEDELSPSQRQLNEVNLGAYVIDADFLRSGLMRLEPHAPKGEYFLTDLVGQAVADGRAVEAVVVEGGSDVMGINSLSELETAGKAIYRKKNQALMESGVRIMDTATTFIEDDVEIDADTTVLPFTLISGRTRIGKGCTIGPNVEISDSAIGNNCHVRSSTVVGAEIEDNVRVGPYAHIRLGTYLASGVEIGSHAEVKDSRLGARTRMHHFGYIGDASIGSDVNIGAGVVTCNYDGLKKERTKVGDGAFLGSDTMLRAPIEVGEQAYTGAGSVVTRIVEAGETVAGVPARPIARKEKAESGLPNRDGSRQER